MDAYEYALMKETLESIQKKVNVWRHNIEMNPDMDDMSDDMMYEIETLLDEAGFHD